MESPVLERCPEMAGAAGAAARNVLLGRQPIYHADRKVHGYELLFRSSEVNAADVRDGDMATAEVILNAVTGIGLDAISSGEPLFINCTRTFLERDPMLPPSRFVLEVLENIEVDRDLIARMKALRAAGYRLALDDFTLGPGTIEAVKLADYVKLDVLTLSSAALKDHVEHLRPYGVTLIAEKVDSDAHMQMCVDLGVDLFQGYYLRRPDVLSKKRLSTTRLAGLRVIAECHDPDKGLEQIAAAISADVGLSYGLLRLANSGMFGSRVRVESIAQAAMRLGTEMIARWAALLVMVSDRDCPAGYVHAALQRAFMCEAVAERQGLGTRGFFLTGLLSVLDTVTGAPMREILDSLPLAEHLQRALMSYEGDLGRVLRVVLDYEAGDWEALRRAGLQPEAAAEAFWAAVVQTEEITKSLLMAA